MYKRILVPLDGPAFAEAILPRAQSLTALIAGTPYIEAITARVEIQVIDTSYFRYEHSTAVILAVADAMKVDNRVTSPTIPA